MTTATTDPSALAAAEAAGIYDYRAMYHEAVQLMRDSGPERPEQWILRGYGSRLGAEHCEFLSTADIELAGGPREASGRRVIAKRAIEPGTLLVASRALAMSSQMRGEEIPVDADGAVGAIASPKIVAATGGGDLAARVLQACVENESVLRLARTLSGGDSMPPPEGSPFEVPFETANAGEQNTPGVDPMAIAAICAENCYRASTSCFAIGHLTADGEGGLLDEFSGEDGLWVIPSAFNHSCAPSAYFIGIGDFLFLFSSRYLAAGTEVCVAYTPPDSPFARRSKAFSSWNAVTGKGFECVCERCSYVRFHPRLAEIEIGMEDRWSRAIGLMKSGLGGGAAAARCLPEGKELAEIRDLTSLPAIHRWPLWLLLELEIAVLNGERKFPAVYAGLRVRAEIDEGLWGEDVSGVLIRRLKSDLHRITLARAGLSDSSTAAALVCRARMRSREQLRLTDKQWISWLQKCMPGMMDTNLAHFMAQVLSGAEPPALYCHICQSGPAKVCSRCKAVPYCSPSCQRRDWARHKLICKAPP